MFILSLSSVLILSLANSAHGQCDGLPGCVLVFSDEFDGTEVDLSKWTFQLGDGSEVGLPGGWGNNEIQYYQAENATVAGGFLTITAREEAVGGLDYTSARMRSLGKADFTYGRFEMRAKMPIGQGLWPGFWMLSSDPSRYGTWAASGEIDIAEYIGNEPHKVYGTIHYGAPWPGDVASGSEYSLPAGTFNDDFHVFAVEWEYGEIRWYVDGILYGTKTDWFSTGGLYPAPFDVDFHLLLNMAVGGDWPGPPDATTVFPQEYVVDYVRVYQVPNDPPVVTITSPVDGAVVTPGTDLTITATATDDGSIEYVEFFQGSASLGMDDTAPYEVTVYGIAPGCYEITARARDDGGLAAGSDQVNITAGAGCPQAPYLMTPASIPGTIEVENYDIGGQGVAYNDSDPTNNGGFYRPAEGVDIEGTTDAGLGYNVGWTVAGEWVEYQVNTTAGIYDVNVRVASATVGGTLHLEFDGVDKTGPVSFANTGGWQNWTTVTVEDVELDAGVQTMRLAIDAGEFNVNWISAEPAGGPAPAFVVFDDMEHGNPFGSGWFTFGGSVGGGGIGPNSGDLPPVDGGSFSLETGWGSGGVPGFFGGFGRTHPIDISATTHFKFWINPDAVDGLGRDQDYTLEINLQEDDNGDGAISQPDDDEFQYNCVVSPTGPCAISGGGWQLVSIPLADFFDDNSFLFGGNGVLDAQAVSNGGNGQLINVVYVVISNSGADATFRTDYWHFAVESPTEVVFDDFEHGDPFGNGWFAFGGAVGGGGIGPDPLDLPPFNGGSFSLGTGWGSGGVPGWFGGFGRTYPVDVSNTEHFSFWINPDGVDGVGRNQDYLLEINLQDDDNGDNAIPFPPDGADDEFQYNCVISPTGPCAVAGGGWQLVSIPLADFFDDNSFHFGGNGVFDPKPVERDGNGQLVNIVVTVISSAGADATFRTDYWIFGDPMAPEIAVAPLEHDFGTVDLGAHGGPVAVTVTNEGSASLIVSAITLDNNEDDEFSLLAVPPVLPTPVLPSGGSLTFDILYLPVNVGADTARVYISSNDADESLVEVLVTGDVTTESAFDGIQDAVSGLGLPAGLTNALLKKLQNARASYENGKNKAAPNQLYAFINQVEDMRGEELTDEEADHLIALAQAIIDAINEGLSKGDAALASQDHVVPTEFVLDGNYPNPFNPTTSIRFGVPEASDVTLTVYDLMGREVRVLVSGTVEAGIHSVAFEASGLPSGPYFYRLVTEAGAFDGKMLLLK